MRQRITFFQEPIDAVDPSTLVITDTSVEIKDTQIRAAREERITFAFDELPQELYRVLKASYEVHVRWVSEEVYDGIGPLVSRLSPGLHVFYTPQRGGGSEDLLCPLLEKAFGFKGCVSPEKSFTNLPTDRFSHSTSHQFYIPLPSLHPLKSYLFYKLCFRNSALDDDCSARVSSLDSAAYLDLDYSTISHAFSLTSFHPSSPQSLRIISPPSNIKSRIEVGLLTSDATHEIEELSQGGFLVVIGENQKPVPTLFAFPSRHHHTSQTFTSNFNLPTGLHPTLKLGISDIQPPLEDRTCTLHAHLTLPKQIFIDKYQLSDPLFLSSKSLSAIHYITTPVDLEAPSYTVPTWGSTVLLELAPPSSTSNSNQEFTAEIPMHLRYLPPNNGTGGYENLEIPYPVLFWACTAAEGSKFPINPFDRMNLGYDGLFGPRTLFYHLSPIPNQNSSFEQPEGRKGGREEVEGLGGGGGRLVNEVRVPVLDLDGCWYVESVTAVGVLIGFGWVLWCLFGVWRGSAGSKKIDGGKKKN